MKYGSVCSGIEAASSAWHSLGWQPAFFSEIEPFPRAVLAHHYPSVPLHGDFTTIGADQYGAIDLLVGGTPCQSFSIAGLRGGLDDDRGNLALEFLRLADRTRARWVVWENVPGVLSSNGGRDFGSILGGLGELGYGWAYRVLDAQFFGVAQRRRRVFVVGYLGDWRRAAAVLFERHSMSGHPAPRRETGQSVARSIRAQSQSSHREDSDNFLATWPAEIAPTLNAHFGDKQGIENQHINGGAGMFFPAISPCLDTQKGGLRGPDTQAYVVGALPASLGKGLGHNKDDFCVPVAFDWQSGGDARGLEPKDTAQLQRCQVPAVAQASAVRRLTPRECERLQGFPDDWTAIPWRKKGANACPDGPRYKALGNSMAVPVMRWIGQRIQMVENMIRNSNG
jgi:DNA (cytosine-5)-methyltransferase 1